jgi:hypothetical protein
MNTKDYVFFPFLKLPNNYDLTKNYNAILLPVLDSVVCRTEISSPLFKSLYNLYPNSDILTKFFEQESHFNNKKLTLMYQEDDSSCWEMNLEKKIKGDFDDTQYIKYYIKDGASFLHGAAKNDPSFFNALARGCKAETYTPRQFSFFMGLTDNLIDNIFQEFTNVKDQLIIYTNKKHINVGFNKPQRIEFSLYLYKKLYFSLGVTETPHDIIIGSQLGEHIIIASKKSQYYPTILREFNHITTAIIFVYKNNYILTYNNEEINVLEYILASMSNQEGHAARLSLMTEQIKENLGFFYTKGNKIPGGMMPWWDRLYRVLSGI